MQQTVERLPTDEFEEQTEDLPHRSPDSLGLRGRVLTIEQVEGLGSRRCVVKAGDELFVTQYD